jgi:MFS family permease
VAVESTSVGEGNGGKEVVSNGYRNYVLSVLVIVYVINFVDRQVLAILQDSIKADLALTDTQLGLLGGVAFAIFYSTLGIPLAAWADRWIRKSILAMALIVWSGMTALCGLAPSFAWLLALRIGVGVGEAGASPPSHSLISDYFPPKKRATALSIYSLGIPIGSALGFIIGGWGDQLLSWRATFMLVGIPGIFMAFVVQFTLREPERGMSDPGHIHRAEDKAPPLRVVWETIKTRTAFWWLAFATAFHSLVGYGLGGWNGSFLRRFPHDLDPGVAGTWLAILGIPAALGTFFGGWAADRIADKTGEDRWYMWLPGLATISMLPFQIVAYRTDNTYLTLTMFAFATFLASMYLGPAFGITQRLVDVRMRAVAAAILLFVLNIIGMGIGPWLVGLLSSSLSGEGGLEFITDMVIAASGSAFDTSESLRWSLVTVAMFNIVATTCYLFSSKYVRRDLEAARV